jgi:hypothetical protein
MMKALAARKYTFAVPSFFFPNRVMPDRTKVIFPGVYSLRQLTVYDIEIPRFRKLLQHFSKKPYRTAPERCTKWVHRPDIHVPSPDQGAPAGAQDQRGENIHLLLHQLQQVLHVSGKGHPPALLQ